LHHRHTQPLLNEPANQAGRHHGLAYARGGGRSEEHTSELQSLTNLVCRLLLEKKKKETHHIQAKKIHHASRHKRKMKIDTINGCSRDQSDYDTASWVYGTCECR